MIEAVGKRVVYDMAPKRARQIAAVLERCSNAVVHVAQLRTAADQAESQNSPSGTQSR